MGFSIETSVSALVVFAQGLLSFFSPCVLPLVPLYLSYLAGGAEQPKDDRARRRLILRNTLFFILGISFAFFVLGLGFTQLGQMLTGSRALVVRVGGILIIVLGLSMLLGGKGTQREWRLPFNLSKWGMNPLTALVLGFTFSFAWTPCVGPALSSVLLMAGSAATRGQGFLLIGVYTLGFVLPFLAVGLFTSQVLAFFKRHGNWLRYTTKVGAVLLIVMGVMMFTGWMNRFTSYLSGLGAPGLPSTSQSAPSQPGSAPGSQAGGSSSAPDSAPNAGSDSQQEAIPAPDFTLVDQFGNSHTLSDYKGKVVFLNFWASWCGPCRSEMPDIQSMYEDLGENGEESEVIVLGVANPKHADHPYSQDSLTKEELADWLQEGSFRYPTVMDEDGSVFANYGISAFPTTFMIDADGNVFGYVSGAISRDIMDNIVDQTRNGVRAG